MAVLECILVQLLLFWSAFSQNVEASNGDENQKTPQREARQTDEKAHFHFKSLLNNDKPQTHEMLQGETTQTDSLLNQERPPSKAGSSHLNPHALQVQSGTSQFHGNDENGLLRTETAHPSVLQGDEIPNSDKLPDDKHKLLRIESAQFQKPLSHALVHEKKSRALLHPGISRSLDSPNYKHGPLHPQDSPHEEKPHQRTPNNTAFHVNRRSPNHHRDRRESYFSQEVSLKHGKPFQKTSGKKAAHRTFLQLKPLSYRHRFRSNGKPRNGTLQSKKHHIEDLLQRLKSRPTEDRIIPCFRQHGDPHSSRLRHNAAIRPKKMSHLGGKAYVKLPHSTFLNTPGRAQFDERRHRRLNQSRVDFIQTTPQDKEPNNQMLVHPQFEYLRRAYNHNNDFLLRFQKHVRRHEKNRLVSLPDLVHPFNFGSINAAKGKLKGVSTMRLAAGVKIDSFLGATFTHVHIPVLFKHLILHYDHFEVIPRDGRSTTGRADINIQHAMLMLKFTVSHSTTSIGCEFSFDGAHLINPGKLQMKFTGIEIDKEREYELKRYVLRFIANAAFIDSTARHIFHVFLPDFDSECKYINKTLNIFSIKRR